MTFPKIILAAIIVLAARHILVLFGKRKELGPGKVLAIAALKAGWIAALLTIVLMPARPIGEREEKPRMILLLDGTESYRFPGADTPGRYARALEWLRRGAWEDLAARFDLSAYQLSGRGPARFESLEDISLPPEGGVTPLDSALETLVRAGAGAPIVLLSDGLDTSRGLPPRTFSPPPGGPPLYLVEFPYRPRERVLFTAIRHDRAAWRGAPWKIAAELAGSWRSPVEVELLAGGEVVESRRIPEAREGEPARTTIEFRRRFRTLGDKPVGLRIAAGPEAVIGREYRAAIDIRPLPARKVWFVTFARNVDSIFWRRTLRSLTSVELTSTTVYRPEARIGELWAYQETEEGRQYLAAEEMEELGRFDLVIVHGSPPVDPVHPFNRGLRRYLEGGGCSVRAAASPPWRPGRESGEEEVFAPAADPGLGDAPFNLAARLPGEIAPGASPDPRFNPAGFRAVEISRPEAVEVILSHPTLRSLHGPYPLFVRRAAGRGIVTDFFPLDTWRMAVGPGGADIHRRLVQWIMDQTAPQYPSPYHLTPPDRLLAAGLEYEFRLVSRRERARYRDPRPVIEGPAARIIAASSDGFEAAVRWIPETPGLYTLSVFNPDGEEIQREDFRVEGEWLEWAYPAADRSDLAAAVEAAGGGLIPAAAFNPEDILYVSGEPEVVNLAATEPVWDRWWLFLILTACLLGEWAVRRGAGLA